MIDFCGEIAFGGSEGIVSGEGDIEVKGTASIRRVFRAKDGGLPMELISINGSSRAVVNGLFLEFNKLFSNSFLCHVLIF